MKTPLTPRTIALETPHYILRTLERADAELVGGDWLADPLVARNLNTRGDGLNAETMLRFIESADRTSVHVLGIFVKETGQLIGIRSVYVDPGHDEFQVNILVGEREARGKRAGRETSDAMYGYFFNELDLLAARATTVSTNERMVKSLPARGWVHEHTSHKPSATGDGMVELWHFRLKREAWRKRMTGGVPSSVTAR